MDDSSPEVSAERARPLPYTAIALAVGTVAIVVVLGRAFVARNTCIVESSESREMLLAIRGAEDGYRAEHGTYKGCTAGGDHVAAYYPRPPSSVDDRKARWDDPTNPDYACWKELGARSSGPVRLSYSVTAGPGGQMIAPRPPGVSEKDWPFDGSVHSDEPYFVAVAVGEVGEATVSYVSSASAKVVTVDRDATSASARDR